MKYLFIDSTYDLTLGILDERFDWISFESFSGQKASSIIQQKVFELLQRHDLNASDLSSLYCVYGPGFYTGLRLAEGFADVFNFFGIQKYSFYSYEIPRWCGFNSGVWFTKAYRGEYFFYQWKGEKNSQKLVGTKDLDLSVGDDQFFIHSSSSLDSLSSTLIKNPILTFDLLKQYPNAIFSKVTKGIQCEPFYFRAPEDEFKVNP